MASGDIFERYQPKSLTSESGPGGPGEVIGVGVLSGLRLGKGGPTADGSAYLAMGRVWTNGTPLPTGLTVEVALCDDPNNPDPGAAVVIGVTIVPLVSGTGTVNDPAQTQEVTATVTLNATEGVITTASIALANSHLASLAAGNYFMLRIRRVATNSADTHTGCAILLNASVKDT